MEQHDLETIAPKVCPVKAGIWTDRVLGVVVFG
jgi:hypothetical protein